MKNKDIREYAKRHSVKLWQIAAELNINDGNFSRKLRYELSDEAKQQIFKIIDALAK
jgi:uncharacterized FlaG/YvyC family protein